MNKLTNRQRVFVELYLTLWNATEAARQAGYAGKNADVQGPRLLGNVGIQKAIEARISQKTATADEVLMRLTKHSRGSMDDFIKGQSINLDQARERGVMDLLKKYKVTTTTIVNDDGDGIETHRVEVELYDAQAATVQLGRALGLFVDRQEVTGANGGPIEINDGIYDRILARIQERLAGAVTQPAIIDAGKPGNG